MLISQFWICATFRPFRDAKESISPNSSYLRTNLKRNIPIEKPISVHWLRRVTLLKINLSVSWNRPLGLLAPEISLLRETNCPLGFYIQMPTTNLNLPLEKQIVPLNIKLNIMNCNQLNKRYIILFNKHAYFLTKEAWEVCHTHSANVIHGVNFSTKPFGLARKSFLRRKGGPIVQNRRKSDHFNCGRLRTRRSYIYLTTETRHDESRLWSTEA